VKDEISESPHDCVGGRINRLLVGLPCGQFQRQQHGGFSRCRPRQRRLTALQTCTLRAAIEEANAGPGADVINVPSGNYLLSLGVLPITAPLSIVGDQAIRPVVDAQSASPVFSIDALGQPRRIHVEFHFLTIQNGFAAASGAGIYNRRGELLIDRCLIQSNWAQVTGGAGIYNLSDSIVSLDRSRVSANGKLVDGDAQPPRGGGIYIAGILYVDRSLIASNVAGRGGGIYNPGYMIMRNSTVSGNSADIDTGGILTGGTAYLNNVTVAFNHGFANPGVTPPDKGTSAGGLGGSGLSTPPIRFWRKISSAPALAMAPILSAPAPSPASVTT
jgi:hypothetical protein